MKERFFKVANSTERLHTIYMHRFPNGKLYFGQTVEKNPERRWRKGKGYDINTPVRKAIEHFGWNNIEHIIISNEVEEKDIDDVERFFIAMFQTTDIEFGYNLESGGNENKNMSASTKKVLSIKQKDRWSRLSTDEKEKVRDFGRNALKNKTKEEKKEINKKHGETLRNKTEEEKKARNLKYLKTISKRTEEEKKEILTKRRNTLANRTEEERAKTRSKRNKTYSAKSPEELSEIKRKWKETIDNRTDEQKKESKRKQRETYIREKPYIVQYNLNGDFIKNYECAADAEKELNIPASSILRCCKNKPNHNTAGGYVWKYVDKNLFIYGEKIDARDLNAEYRKKFRESALKKHPRIAQYDAENNLIKIFDFAIDAKRELGIDNSSILKCCKGKKKTVGGFIWKFVE